jgi:maltooligosyltrehalose trehalohydrolase
LTSPFIPMLFQGEEFAACSPFLYFTHHDDPALGQAVSEGRRNEFKAFGWSPEEVPDPQDHGSFEKSKLLWDEIDREPHRSIFSWYKKLIQLRRSIRWLSDGKLELVDTDYDEQAGWFILHRGPVQVLCNFSTDRQAVPLDCEHGEIICSEEGWSLRPGMIELPAESAAIATSS